MGATFRGGLDERIVGCVIGRMGGGGEAASGTFPAGGGFPPYWLRKHIIQKKMYALYNLLQQFCA